MKNIDGMSVLSSEDFEAEDRRAVELVAMSE